MAAFTSLSIRQFGQDCQTLGYIVMHITTSFSTMSSNQSTVTRVVGSDKARRKPEVSIDTKILPNTRALRSEFNRLGAQKY